MTLYIQIYSNDLKFDTSRMDACHYINHNNYNYYYDLRFIILAPINIFLRNYFALIFSDYTASNHTFLLVLLLLIVTLLFIFTSINLNLHGYRNGSRLFIMDILVIRIGYKEWSFFLTIAFLTSVLCPPLIFSYIHPCIILASLSPFFFNLFRCLLLRLRAAFSAFLSYNAVRMPVHDLPHHEPNSASMYVVIPR